MGCSWRWCCEPHGEGTFQGARSGSGVFGVELGISIFARRAQPRYFMFFFAPAADLVAENYRGADASPGSRSGALFALARRDSRVDGDDATGSAHETSSRGVDARPPEVQRCKTKPKNSLVSRVYPEGHSTRPRRACERKMVRSSPLACAGRGGEAGCGARRHSPFALWRDWWSMRGGLAAERGEPRLLRAETWGEAQGARRVAAHGLQSRCELPLESCPAPGPAPPLRHARGGSASEPPPATMPPPPRPSPSAQRDLAQCDLAPATTTHPSRPTDVDSRPTPPLRPRRT